ncbi:hypothetical protein M8C21_000350 [Ambrosia artemisiifolia]|uniref:Membrane-associated kinase regulator 2 n=1 Tax=Ambrosia artemisiifolia TaxID=4212 RepID=A0AAD5G7U4_AMBAR|nr:hypothetical protein M8C21_000350 [Ambrosia artemisiifolia]
MEALSLLKYWRTNTGEGTNHTNVTTSSNTTTIVTGVSSHQSETGDEEEGDENDHGPFFDLEFSLPEQNETGTEQYLSNEEEHYENNEDFDRSESYEDSDNDGEVKFTLITSSSGESTTDVNISDSPTNNLFFNDGFVPVDNTTETNAKPSQFRLPLVKSATKFRIMMLKFRKLKMNTESNDCIESNSNSNASNSSSSKQVQQKQSQQSQTEESTNSGNAMTVKMKLNVEEVPTVNLFKRHNSSKPTKKQQASKKTETTSSTEEKRFTKETMHKYLRKVKPLYVRVSQKYGEKLKFNGNINFPKVTKTNLSTSSSFTSDEQQKECSETNPKKEKQICSEVEVEQEPPLLQNTGKGLKQGNLPAGLRVVCKHFGKTWSATTTIAAATATGSVVAPGAIPSNRRDDSLLQQQDGIQSAILHCKRSFKASRDSDSPSNNPVAAAGKCENGLVSGEEVEEMRK